MNGSTRSLREYAAPDGGIYCADSHSNSQDFQSSGADPSPRTNGPNGIGSDCRSARGGVSSGIEDGYGALNDLATSTGVLLYEMQDARGIGLDGQAPG